MLNKQIWDLIWIMFLVGIAVSAGVLLPYAIYKNWAKFLGLMAIVGIALAAAIGNWLITPMFRLYHWVRRQIWPWAYGERGEILPRGHIRTNLGVIDTTKPSMYNVARHQSELHPWTDADWPQVQARLGDKTKVFVINARHLQIRKFVLARDVEDYMSSGGKTQISTFQAPWNYLA